MQTTILIKANRARGLEIGDITVTEGTRYRLTAAPKIIGDRKGHALCEVEKMGPLKLILHGKI